MVNHCQVQVPDGTGKVWTLINEDGNVLRNPITCFCKTPPEFVCDSGFKFCNAHKKSHGTRGKDGHIHTFKRLKSNGNKRGGKVAH